MVFEEIDELRRQYTDKHVVVDGGRPELRRFNGRVGRIVTVNMNGQAIVQFDGSSDIGWYDIALEFLKVVPKPEPAKKAEAKAAGPQTTETQAKPAAKSPLEQVRAAAQAKQHADKAPGPSPLDQIRAKSAGETTKPAGKSPLDQIRAKATEQSARPAAQSPLEQPRPAGPGSSAQDVQAPIEAESARSDPEHSKEGQPISADKPLSKLEQAQMAAKKSDSEASDKQGERPLSKLEMARRAKPLKSDGGDPKSS